MLVGAFTYNLCLFKQAHWEGVAVCAESDVVSQRVVWRYSWKLDRLSLANIFQMLGKIPGFEFPKHLYKQIIYTFYFVTSINIAFLSSTSFVLWGQHGGHGPEVGQVFHVVPHA